jgi:CRP-like cAMP-binding protein
MDHSPDLDCPERIRDLLGRQKNFRDLSPGALTLLSELAVPCRLREGESLWKPGEASRSYAAIVRGWIEVQTGASGGPSATTGLFGAGDLIGLTSLFRGGPGDGNPVAAEEGTVVIKLAVRPLLEDWDDTRAAELMNWVRSMYLLHEEVLRDRIEVLAASSVDQKLYVFLKHLLRRFGRESRAGSAVIPVPLSKSQAARIVDIRVETSIRAINTWQQKGLIRWEPDQLRIPSLSALRAAFEPKREKGWAS